MIKLTLGLILTVMISQSYATLNVEHKRELTPLSIDQIKEVDSYIQMREQELRDVGVVGIVIGSTNNLRSSKRSYFIPYNNSVILEIDGRNLGLDQIKKQIEVAIIVRSYDMRSIKISFDVLHTEFTLKEIRDLMTKIEKITDRIERYRIKEIQFSYNEGISSYGTGQLTLQLVARGTIDEAFKELEYLIRMSY